MYTIVSNIYAPSYIKLIILVKRSLSLLLIQLNQFLKFYKQRNYARLQMMKIREISEMVI